MPDEAWRAIPRFEGLYSVSDLGGVRSEGRTVYPANGNRPYKVKPRIMKPGRGTDGYGHIHVRRDGKTFSLRVHQCVALAFLGPVPAGQEVRHKNGVRSDNRLVNLEYGTRAQNIDDAKRHGTFPLGADRPGAVITPEIARQIVASDAPADEEAERHGVNRQVIYAVRNGTAWGDFTDLSKAPGRRRHGNEKLLPETRVEMASAAGSLNEVARRYGVSKKTVFNARKAVALRTGTRRPRPPSQVKLSDDDVRAILADHGTLGAVAERHGVSRQTVYLLRHGLSRQSITRPQIAGLDHAAGQGPDLVVGGAAETGAVGKAHLDQ